MNDTPAIREPRPLGLTAQPSLRLALGYRDEEKRGAPVKTDYFVVKQGAKGEFTKAAQKFTATFGEKPRAIPISLPSTLASALDRRYKAFGQAPGSDDGGVLKALGQTNLVLEGRANGPDTLTVWREDGEIVDLPIQGLEDPAADELGVLLYTTFRFGIPDVLGLTGFCEITTRGTRTTDNLYQRLWGLYAYLGPLVSHVLEPKLVLRPASAWYQEVKTQGGKTTKKRRRSHFYALDLWIPETRSEIRERLREHKELVQAVQPLGLPAAGATGGSWEETVVQSQVDQALTARPPDEYEPDDDGIVEEPVEDAEYEDIPFGGPEEYGEQE